MLQYRSAALPLKVFHRYPTSSMLLSQSSLQPPLEILQVATTTATTAATTTATTNPSNMPTPYLPPEVWQRISTYLPPPSLSSLSKVSHTFTDICTEEQHFRRHLRISQTDTNPALLFRRLQAWFSPTPCTRFTNQPSSPLHPLCVVEDTFLFVDESNFQLRAFPYPKICPLQLILGWVPPDRDLSTYWDLARFKSCYAVLPNASIAFMSWGSPTVLVVLDVAEWSSIKRLVPERKDITKMAMHDYYIALAGNEGQYILYYTDRTTLVLVDWRTGKLVKEFSNVCEHIQYIYGECPATNHKTIVGLVTQRRTPGNGPLTDVLVTGFDGIEVDFAIAWCQHLYAVLRSADTNTHVLIAYNSSDVSDEQYEFVAYRNHAHSVKSWSGYLTMRAPLRLQNNGRTIAAVRNYKLRRSVKYETTKRRTLYLELKDDGTTEEFFVPELNDPGCPIWHRRTFDGGFALIGSSSGLVQLVKLCKNGQAENNHLINSWQIDDLKNLTVLLDHVIVAELLDGSLRWFHFDRFCRGVKGVYACPMTDLLATFQFRPGSKDIEAELPAQKRTRRQ